MKFDARDAAMLAGYHDATDSALDTDRYTVEQLAVKWRRLDEQGRADHVEHMVTMRRLTLRLIV